jgi:hypothetical protein
MGNLMHELRRTAQQNQIQQKGNQEKEGRS